MLSLVVAMALAQAPLFEPRFSRLNSRTAQGRSDRGLLDDDLAFFEAFPSTGAGTSGACSTTAPTGAKGETLTFTRASNATCTKTATGGLATTGIANGDLVVLSSNQPRVEYDSQGVLGLLVESSRTNSDLRSEEIDNAWWSDVATGAANPTLNGTCANSPLASPTSTPEDYTFPATTAGQQSGRLGTVIAGLAAVAGTHSFYVCGVGGAGSMDICVWNTTTPTCSTCDFPACSSNTWNRCTRTATSSGNVATFIGNNTLYNGGTSRSSNRVCVTGAQAEAGSYATSYIPTTSAAVTRAADSAGAFTLTAVGPSGSIAASVQFPSTAVGAVNIAAFGAAGAGNNWTLYRNTDTAAGYQIGTTVTTPAVSSMSTTTHRTALADNAGMREALWDTTSVSAPAASLSGTQTVVWVGAGVSGGTPSNGIVSRFCLDPDPSRCR